MVEIGHTGGGFAFDNEGPAHIALLRPFALADRLVTCGEWKAFIADGGYERPELWLSDGWHTARREGWEAPLYWERDDDTDGCWTLLSLDGRRAVRDDEPVVHVSHYEADAYAHWTGFRLPTEQEWETIAVLQPTDGNLLDAESLATAAVASDDRTGAEQSRRGDAAVLRRRLGVDVIGLPALPEVPRRRARSVSTTASS